jgi:hypothetical protein
MGTSVKYLGLHLDKRLTWPTHIKTKRKSLNLRLHKLRQLLRSRISLESKMLIYKQLICPAMTYVIQLWGSTKMSNLKIFQVFQPINLRILTNAPWYVNNRSLHHDLNVPTISVLVLYNYNNFHKNVLSHPNPLVDKLASKTLPNNPPRRLKRKLPRDFIIN